MHLAESPQQALILSRGLRLVIQGVALVLAVTVLIGTAVDGTASAATHAGAEGSFVTKMNAERRASGLGRLTIDVQLTRVARSWSEDMAHREVLGHNPRLATQVKGDWRRVGENVGYTSFTSESPDDLVTRLHRAFMASPGHRANILREYNQVGVGVTLSANSKLWVTVVFAQASLPATRRQVGDAVAGSRAAFPTAGADDGAARYVTLAAAAPTADPGALRHSPMGPTLVTPAPSTIEPSPLLHPLVRAEIDRVLGGRGTVYLVGDETLVSARAARELVGDGYLVQRIRRTADVTAETPADVIVRSAQILGTS